MLMIMLAVTFALQNSLQLSPKPSITVYLSALVADHSFWLDTHALSVTSALWSTMLVIL